MWDRLEADLVIATDDRSVDEVADEVGAYLART